MSECHLPGFDQRDVADTRPYDPAVDPVAVSPDTMIASTLQRCQFLVLAQIANFAGLRRHIGRQRADLLIGDIGERIGALVPAARIVMAGRDLIELSFDGEVPLELDAALAALEAIFDLPFDVDGEPHLIEMALGAAITVGQRRDDVRLVEEAERALADARADRRPVVRDVTMAASSIDRIALSRELTAAIARDELFLQYQPKVHLRRQEITSVEALIRWQHPTRGLILPSDFIPIAEESRDIATLTLWTIRQAIADQKILAGRGYPLRIFINIAGALLGDARFVRSACALVKSNEAELGFEITETSVIRDPDSAIAHLQVFADMGITVAIDDYGAGLSSLAYLKQLPARELKIDKLFVTQLTSSNRDPLIVRSTIDLAHALEMEVVAEGVETPAALALLTVMGCDMVQGFLISRPIGLDALIRFLDEDRHLVTTEETRASFSRLAAVWQRG